MKVSASNQVNPVAGKQSHAEKPIFELVNGATNLAGTLTPKVDPSVAFPSYGEYRAD